MIRENLKEKLREYFKYSYDFEEITIKEITEFDGDEWKDGTVWEPESFYLIGLLTGNCIDHVFTSHINEESYGGSELDESTCRQLINNLNKIK